MVTLRAVGLLCAAAAAAVLGACATDMAAEPPVGVSLAGAWKLDPAASDDPQKLLAQMRAEARKILARRAQAAAMPPAPRPGQRGGGGAAGDSSTQDQDQAAYDEAAAPPAPGAQRPDPLRHSPMAHIIAQTVDRGDFLTIKQGPGDFVLDYGGSRRSFTPGARSVVSAEGGVGDQTSGWKGRAYVIHVKAQMGPDVTEEYGLSSDGKELVAKLHLASGELPAVTLTRVYRPTGEIAPRQLPTND